MDDQQLSALVAEGEVHAADHHQDQEEAVPLSGTSSSDVTVVTFGDGPLGLKLGEHACWSPASASEADGSCFSAIVDRLNKNPDGSPGPAERTGVVQLQDLVTAVNDRSVANEVYTRVIELIKAAPRPLTLSFRRPSAAAAVPAERVGGVEEGVPKANGASVSGAGTASALQRGPSPPPSLPQDVVHTVTQTASWVAKHGEAFERTIRRRNEGNPNFSFLFDGTAESAAFYRARLDHERQVRPGSSGTQRPSPETETEVSQAENDLVQRINAAHADIAQRIGQASSSLAAEGLAAPQAEAGGQQDDAWAVLQELRLQEDVLEAVRKKASSWGGQLDPGSNALVEMTFARVVHLTEQLAEIELGRGSPTQKRRFKSAPPRERRGHGRTPHRTRSPRQPGSTRSRTGDGRRSRSRSARSSTPEPRRVRTPSRPRAKSAGQRRRSHGVPRVANLDYYSARPRRFSGRSSARADSVAERLDEELRVEYSEAPPFGSSSERFWPQVLPTGRHRSAAFRRGGDEDSPGPGSYAEHQPMGQSRGGGWRVGNDDLYAFLRAAAADDHLPSFWHHGLPHELFDWETHPFPSLEHNCAHRVLSRARYVRTDTFLVLVSLLLVPTKKFCRQILSTRSLGC